MRFGLIHRIMTDALAALGLLSLLASGELNHWFVLATLIGLAIAIVLPQRYQDHGVLRRVSVVLPLSLLALQMSRLFSGESLLPLAVEFAAALQVVRLATRRGAAHDQQVVVLALMHLIAGTVLGGGLSYGLCFLGFLVVAPGALVLSHLRREVEGNYRQGARDRTGLPVDVPRILRSRRVIGRPFLIFTCLLSVPIFLFTAIVFVMFPRVGLSLLLLGQDRRERVVGFSDRVDLGGVGKLRADPTIVMRVEHPNLPAEPPMRLALYLRGAAFDRYNGHSWSRSALSNEQRVEQIGSSVRLRRWPDPVRDRKLRIDLEPIEPSVVFLPPDAVALSIWTPTNAVPSAVPALYVGQEGQIRYRSQSEGGLRYEVVLADGSEPSPPALDTAARARYLALPTDLPPRVAELAKSWIGEETDPERRAKRVETALRKGYRYDLESPSGAAKNPLDDFLFVSKRGHCEFYSTAMAILLRTQGVPTRNVNGFIGGTFNRFGRYYAVRQGDAHSWVEVYVDGKGFVRFDPTPPADAAPQSEITGVLAFVRDMVEAAAQRWDRNVIGYDMRQQVSLLRAVRDRYTDLRSRSKVASTVLASPRRAFLSLTATGLLIALAVYWYRRRRKPTPQHTPPNANEVRQRETAELYRALDSALSQRGVPRPSGTPPLTHVRALALLGHPIADSALRLTERYLRARFGHEAFTVEERKEFLREVRELSKPPREQQLTPAA
jgi:transglutaminase-like putative cysteine protease